MIVPKERNCPLCSGSLRRFDIHTKEFWCGCIVNRKYEAVMKECSKPLDVVVQDVVRQT